MLVGSGTWRAVRPGLWGQAGRKEWSKGVGWLHIRLAGDESSLEKVGPATTSHAIPASHPPRGWPPLSWQANACNIPATLHADEPSQSRQGGLGVLKCLRALRCNISSFRSLREMPASPAFDPSQSLSLFSHSRRGLLRSKAFLRGVQSA